MSCSKTHIDFLQNALKNANVKAFLLTIRLCEGCDADNGYQVRFGGSRKKNLYFNNGYKDHPRIKEPFGDTYSDAAGAYQIMSKTFDGLVKNLGLVELAKSLNVPIFAPTIQDICAVELLSEHNCLQKLMDGNFDFAIKACNTTWASLPGSPYGQPTKTLTECIVWYTSSGGQRLNTPNLA